MDKVELIFGKYFLLKGIESTSISGEEPFSMETSGKTISVSSDVSLNNRVSSRSDKSRQFRSKRKKNGVRMWETRYDNVAIGAYRILRITHLKVEVSSTFSLLSIESSVISSDLTGIPTHIYNKHRWDNNFRRPCQYFTVNVYNQFSSIIQASCISIRPRAQRD